jgi:hypothetical protein
LGYEALCNFFPRTDPVGALSRDERKDGLRVLAEKICEFLKSEAGLSAAAPIQLGSVTWSLTVDAAVVKDRTGVDGVTEVRVICASMGDYLRATLVDEELEDAVSPITVSFRVPGIPDRDKPFFAGLAEAYGVPDEELVFGYILA